MSASSLASPKIKDATVTGYSNAYFGKNIYEDNELAKDEALPEDSHEAQKNSVNTKSDDKINDSSMDVQGMNSGYSSANSNIMKVARSLEQVVSNGEALVNINLSSVGK